MEVAVPVPVEVVEEGATDVRVSAGADRVGAVGVRGDGRVATVGVAVGTTVGAWGVVIVVDVTLAVGTVGPAVDVTPVVAVTPATGVTPAEPVPVSGGPRSQVLPFVTLPDKNWIGRLFPTNCPTRVLAM